MKWQTAELSGPATPWGLEQAQKFYFGGRQLETPVRANKWISFLPLVLFAQQHTKIMLSLESVVMEQIRSTQGVTLSCGESSALCGSRPLFDWRGSCVWHLLGLSDILKPLPESASRLVSSLCYPWKDCMSNKWANLSYFPQRTLNSSHFPEQNICIATHTLEYLLLRLKPSQAVLQHCCLWGFRLFPKTSQGPPPCVLIQISHVNEAKCPLPVGWSAVDWLPPVVLGRKSRL